MLFIFANEHRTTNDESCHNMQANQATTNQQTSGQIIEVAFRNPKRENESRQAFEAITNYPY